MAEQWFYASHDQQKGPVDTAALKDLAQNGAVTPMTLVWCVGMPSWIPAGQMAGIFPEPAPAFQAPPQMQAAGALPPQQPMPAPYPYPPQQGPYPPQPGVQQPNPHQGDGVLMGFGNKITDMANLPSLTGVPFAQLLTGGLNAQTKEKDIEEIFTVGTRQTTPSLSQIDTEWPKPRVFWRVLGAAVVLYVLLRIGYTNWENKLFIPGMIVAGAFAVPFAVVVFFFEMNVPRNVSVYQAGKMLMIGGAFSLIGAMILFGVFKGAGTKDLISALQVGVVEETAKLLALLIIAYECRFRWQMNGLLFGAAVGAGFGGFESAGYAFVHGMGGGIEQMFTVIHLRGFLAPGMHVAWSAMIGAALWRAKGAQPFNFSMLFNPVVVRMWVIAVVLHGLWDTPFDFLKDVNNSMIKQYIYCGMLTLTAWFVLFGIMKQALQEIRLAKSQASSVELGQNPAMSMIFSNKA
jgi:RsiW-degrading membrane proteinase PrsW (M82 family)